MQQAIVTKYIGPNHIRSSRIVAYCGLGSLQTSWEPQLTTEENHKVAATQMAALKGEHDAKTLYGAYMPANEGFVWVVLPKLK